MSVYIPLSNRANSSNTQNKSTRQLETSDFTGMIYKTGKPPPKQLFFCEVDKLWYSADAELCGSGY